MKELRYTLVSDGSSDRALIPILTWLLGEHVVPGKAIHPAWADLSRLPRRPKGLAERVCAAIDLFPCDLLLVHRDAECEPLEKREAEIQDACSDLGEDVPFVGVVPVRMQEAWLLFDEKALRRAAGNPNGRNRLDMPAVKKVAEIPNPKGVLHELLREASGLSGRRRTRFLAQASAQRVAELIDDFSPLRGLTAFARMEAMLKCVLKERGWLHQTSEA